MPRINVKDLKNGSKVISTYMVKGKRLVSYKGRPGCFLTLTLTDSTGQAEAKVWERGEIINDEIKAGDLIEVTGDVREYNGALQINIGSFRICADNEFDPRQFLAVSPQDPAKMLKELKEIASLVENRHLSGLIQYFFNDRQWLDLFCAAPAAKANHHAYLGGLLEHTLSVSRGAVLACRLYPRLDRDLMLAGSILHDIGKVWEYTYQRYIDYTDEGRLIGHIVNGASEIEKRIKQFNPDDPFPDNLRLKLLHIIVSHHGQYEWQSPKKPKFVEAAVIHILDMLDATVDEYYRAADGADSDSQSWSPWARVLERQVYLK